MQDFLSAFEFLSKNIHLAGWVFVMGLVWKISRFFTKLEERTKKTEETIEVVATNHLPHLQSGIENVNDTLKELHRDILHVLIHKNE